MAGSLLWLTGLRVVDPTTGAPLSGAKLYTYLTATTTDKTTYSNKALSTANPNPLVTNSAGLFEVSGSRVDVWGSGSFKFVLKTSTMTTLATYDPVDDVVTTVSSAGANAKSSVRAATTANITLSAAQTIDGISVVASDRVLVKDQSTGAENGIYLVASGSWTRTTDLDEDADALGFWVAVREGTANGAKIFGLTTDGTIVVGTTSMTIAELADPTTEIDTEKKSDRGRSSKSAAYDLVADDAGKTVELTGSTTRAFTITVGTHAIDDFGFIEQLGTGQLTVTAGTSTTLRFHSDFVAKCRGQYSTIAWKKISSTEIILTGDLDPA